MEYLAKLILRLQRAKKIEFEFRTTCGYTVMDVKVNATLEYIDRRRARLIRIKMTNITLRENRWAKNGSG